MATAADLNAFGSGQVTIDDIVLNGDIGALNYDISCLEEHIEGKFHEDQLDLGVVASLMARLDELKKTRDHFASRSIQTTATPELGKSQHILDELSRFKLNLQEVSAGITAKWSERSSVLKIQCKALAADRNFPDAFSLDCQVQEEETEFTQSRDAI